MVSRLQENSVSTYRDTVTVMIWQYPIKGWKIPPTKEGILDGPKKLLCIYPKQTLVKRVRNQNSLAYSKSLVTKGNPLMIPILINELNILLLYRVGFLRYRFTGSAPHQIQLNNIKICVQKMKEEGWYPLDKEEMQSIGSKMIDAINAEILSARGPLNPSRDALLLYASAENQTLELHRFVFEQEKDKKQSDKELAK